MRRLVSALRTNSKSSSLTFAPACTYQENAPDFPV